MKKYFGLLAIICFTMICVGLSSCSKDEDDESTYTFTWDTSSYMIDDVYLFEYSEAGDKIASNEVGSPSQGHKYKFTATSRAVKVKVYYEINGKPRWVQQVFYLEKGKNKDIVVNGESMVGSKEP